MRQLILRALTVITLLVSLIQAVPALAATMSPHNTAQPATTMARAHVVTTLVLESRAHPLKPRARVDHALVTKAWANIRTVPTTIGNRPVGHFSWHSRFTALHRIVYGQHPYGAGSSNHWLKIASGRYKGDFVWSVGVTHLQASRGPPALTSRSAEHVQPRRHHRVARRHAYRTPHRRSHRAPHRHYGGTLGCSGLEALWRSAGGASWAAHTAASIAMAESSGRQYAHSPTNDYGYWQINSSHGPGMATYNAYGNARAAVIISGNGTNWRPWATYTSGAYSGRC